jgi:hypothetical protein
VADVGDPHFVKLDGVENEISQTRHNNHTRIGLVGCAAFARCITERPRVLNEPRHEA